MFPLLSVHNLSIEGRTTRVVSQLDGTENLKSIPISCAALRLGSYEGSGKGKPQPVVSHRHSGVCPIFGAMSKRVLE